MLCWQLDGGEFGGEWTHIYVWESFCCAPEITPPEGAKAQETFAKTTAESPGRAVEDPYPADCVGMPLLLSRFSRVRLGETP